MPKQLSSKAIAVLTLIAEGQSYSQIVDGHPNITYLDIFHAAEEALRLNEPDPAYQARLAAIREKHPRAYEKWTDQEDAELRSLHEGGSSTNSMAAHFQRQPSAIESRLGKLDIEANRDR